MQKQGADILNWYDEVYTTFGPGNQPGTQMVQRDTQRVYLRFSTSQNNGTYGVMHESYVNDGFSITDLKTSEPLGNNIPPIVFTQDLDPWLVAGAWFLTANGSIPIGAAKILVYQVFLRRGPLCGQRQRTTIPQLSELSAESLLGRTQGVSGLSSRPHPPIRSPLLSQIQRRLQVLE